MRDTTPHPIAAAAALSRSPRPTTETGYCLRETRELFHVDPKAESAAEAWGDAQFKHRFGRNFTRLDKIPARVPIFWTGGTKGYGHVALSAVLDGYCWSVDILRPGYWDRVPIRLIEERWGLKFVGWTEDLNGVRVYDPNTADER